MKAIKDRATYSYSRLLPASIPAAEFNFSAKSLHTLLLSRFAQSDPDDTPQTDIQTAAAGVYSHSFSSGGDVIGCLSSIFVPDNVGIGLLTQGIVGLNSMGQALSVPIAQFTETSREMALLTIFYNVVNSEPIPVAAHPTAATPLVISGSLPTGQTITTSLISIVSELGHELMSSEMNFKLDLSKLKRAMRSRPR
jgi:hypothetical protein